MQHALSPAPSRNLDARQLQRQLLDLQAEQLRQALALRRLARELKHEPHRYTYPHVVERCADR